MTCPHLDPGSPRSETRPGADPGSHPLIWRCVIAANPCRRSCQALHTGPASTYALSLHLLPNSFFLLPSLPWNQWRHSLCTVNKFVTIRFVPAALMLVSEGTGSRGGAAPAAFFRGDMLTDSGTQKQMFPLDLIAVESIFLKGFVGKTLSWSVCRRTLLHFLYLTLNLTYFQFNFKAELLEY